MNLDGHVFDDTSVLNPVTGQPYGPGPLWAGAEPMDYPDPRCVCGELWGHDGCELVAYIRQLEGERNGWKAMNAARAELGIGLATESLEAREKLLRIEQHLDRCEQEGVHVVTTHDLRALLAETPRKNGACPQSKSP